MKKTVLTVLLTFVCLLPASLSAQDLVQLRLPVVISTPWSGSDWSRAAEAWNDGRNASLGLAPELIFDQLGFAVDGGVRFTRDLAKAWSLDFRGQLYTSFHLFGVQSELDPFVLAGLGSAGWVDLTHGVARRAGDNLSGLSLALAPSLGAGFAVDLGGLVVGLRALWFPTTWAIPVAPIDTYKLAGAELAVFVGWALADHAQW
ncbi:MAG: hypothetical protein WCG80_17085 [Spirochaetales bacterium]